MLQVRITFKNQELLKGVSWDVKKGERVGLVGEPDGGEGHCIACVVDHAMKLFF